MARLAMLAVFAIILVMAAPAAEAITCGQVTGYIESCMPYALGKAATPTGQCCTGIKTLNSVAKSTPDRQATCNCLKNAAKQIKGINGGNVAGLPGKCGVSIPYVISASTDCARVR